MLTDISTCKINAPHLLEKNKGVLDGLLKKFFKSLWLNNRELSIPNLNVREWLSKQSYQLYKKHAAKIKTWAKQLFIAVEMEAESLVKQYGIKYSRPNERFIKAVQKAATAKGMTVAEYRDKILFPHGKERIITRFKQFLKQHPEAKGKPKPPIKNNTSAMAMKRFVSR